MTGTHNTLTSSEPLRWWHRLTVPFWRCQSLSLGSQIVHGVDFFDIRVRRHNYAWHGAHGSVLLDISADEAIRSISFVVERPTVRLILEKGDQADRRAFAQWCMSLEGSYPAVKFIGGNYKPTWKHLYKFSTDDIGDNIDQRVGSMRSWYGKICPWLWAKLHPHRLTEAAMQTRPTLVDFV